MELKPIRTDGEPVRRDFPYEAAADVAAAEQGRKVLRNTYLLLAITMVPTVIGAFVGMATGAVIVAHPVASSLLLLAAVIVVAVQALGNLLVVAILVGPAATARLLAQRMAPAMALAAVIAAACGAAGLYVSYYAGLAAGASVAASAVVAYLAARVAVAARGVRASRTS